VIGGINSPGAAVGAGVFLGGPTLINLFPSLGQLSATAIGAQGVAVGQNPNGAIPNERSRWQPTLQTPPALVGMLVAISLTYLLRITNIINNWTFVVTVLVILVATRLATGHLVRVHDGEASTDREVHSAGLSAPPELLGLVAAYAASDIEALDRRLDLAGVRVEP
jgi:branched-chain amino acid transport system permease protein